MKLKAAKKIKKMTVAKDSNSMLTQKTNEDFNKKQPEPADFKKTQNPVGPFRNKNAKNESKK